MQVGLMINTQFPEGTSVPDRIPEIVTQVKAARDAGFKSLWFPHHWLTHPMQMLQIAPMMGYIAAHAQGELVEEGLVERGLGKSEEIGKVINRYKTIQKKLLNLLQKFGIAKIEFPDNRLIVGLCEVVETEAANNRQNDEILSVVRNGYIRGNELIRAAQIIVVKN